MSFRVSRDGTLSEAKAATSPSGIPFMYNTGDNTTLPSLDSAVPQYIQGTNSTGDHFGRDVAVGNGKIVTGAPRYNDPSGINTINTGIAFIHDLNGNLITSLTDGDSGDLYGTSVAIGSNKIAIGSPSDDDTAFASGAVYVYDLDGTNKVKIKASVPVSSEGYGDGALAVGAGKILVGAKSSPGSSSAEGAVYVYDLDGTNEVKITPSDAASLTTFGSAGGEFGLSVAVGGDKIIVGAPAVDVRLVRTGGNNFHAGKAYIYDLDGTNEIMIYPHDLASGNAFGSSVAFGCGQFAVGSPYEGPPGANNQGAVYTFDLNGNSLKKIKAETPPSITNPNYWATTTFGSSVAIRSGRLFVGDKDIFKNVGSPSKYNVGALYVFSLNGAQIATTPSSDFEDGDRFAAHISVESGRIVAGAKFNDANGSNAGAAYVLDLDGIQRNKLMASDGAAGDFFGGSVAVGSGRIVIGASAKNSNTGAIYIYETPKIKAKHPLDIFNDL